MKSITQILFICCFILPISNVQAQNYSAFIRNIEKEAKELKSNKTEYKNYLKKEDSLFQIRELSIERGMHVHYKPDLTTINVPLAYYYIRLNDSTNNRCYFYLNSGIALSKDIQNRQKFVLYLQSKKNTICTEALNDYDIDWNYYISISGNPQWANNYISSELPSEIDSTYYSYREALPYLIINRWADSLNYR